MESEGDCYVQVVGALWALEFLVQVFILEFPTVRELEEGESNGGFEEDEHRSRLFRATATDSAKGERGTSEFKKFEKLDAKKRKRGTCAEGGA